VSRLLIVTAVAAERDAITGATAADVIVGGVGCVESAVSAANALASGTYDVVISAGIAGGFAPLDVASTAVADTIILADLGAETADGFSPADELGFGRTHYGVDAVLAERLARQTGARVGPILTVNTVTGTAQTALRLANRYPGVIAEAMEGAGVAAAAAAAGVRFGELRAISNRVGPRDRSAWRFADALAALAAAVAKIGVE